MNEISRVNSLAISHSAHTRKVWETCSLCCHYNANVCAWQYTIHFLFTLVFCRFLSQPEVQFLLYCFQNVSDNARSAFPCSSPRVSSRHVLYSRVSQSLHLRTSLLFSVILCAIRFTFFHSIARSYWRYWKRYWPESDWASFFRF